VFDGTGHFADRCCNLEMVDLDELAENDLRLLRTLIENHHRYTQSTIAGHILADWDKSVSEIIKVIPVEYKRALREMEHASLE